MCSNGFNYRDLSKVRIPLIEDAAEFLGATYREKAAGAFGDLSFLSFNGNKIITTSGGGMLLGDDPVLIKQALDSWPIRQGSP